MNPRYNTYLFGLGLGLAIATYFTIASKQPEELWWYIGALGMNVLLGWVVGRLYKGSVEASNSVFYRRVMGATGIRMVVSVSFLAIYLIVSDLKTTYFIGYFLILYLLFTIFEIYQIVAKLRPEK